VRQTRLVPVNVWTVTLAALVTALATGVGALPFLVFREVSKTWLGAANAAAGGFMLAASAALVWQGYDRGAWRMLAGVVVGALVLALARRAIGEQPEAFELGVLRGAYARRALVVIVVMTIHSFSEGVGVGVSYGDGARLGILITAAIAIHNIPEGLAISLVTVPRGTSVRAAAAWSVFSSLPQPLMAAPAFLFVEAFRPILAAGLGFAAGAMAWLVLTELVPAAREDAPPRVTLLAGGLSFAVMLAAQVVALQ
jgi:zinc transporter ZupT